MSRHRKHWACDAGHGFIQEYSDPEYIEIACGHGGYVKMYVNHTEEGDPCNHSPVLIQQGVPYEICKLPLKLEKHETQS